MKYLTQQELQLRGEFHITMSQFDLSFNPVSVLIYHAPVTRRVTFRCRGSP